MVGILRWDDDCCISNINRSKNASTNQRAVDDANELTPSKVVSLNQYSLQQTVGWSPEQEESDVWNDITMKQNQQSYVANQCGRPHCASFWGTTGIFGSIAQLLAPSLENAIHDNSAAECWCKTARPHYCINQHCCWNSPKLPVGVSGKPSTITADRIKN